MTETRFTPGPWECKQVPTSAGRAFRIGKDAMLDPGPRGCCIIYDDYGHGTNERMANANLISAAPDMYAALEMAYEALDTFSVGDDDLVTEAPILAARAALAKARGES